MPLKTRSNDQRLAIWQPRLGAHRMVLLADGCKVLAGNFASAAKSNDPFNRKIQTRTAALQQQLLVVLWLLLLRHGDRDDDYDDNDAE